MMIETLLTAVLVAAGTGKPVARSRLVICPAHTVVQVLHFFSRGLEESLVSGDERREDAHALLQDRVEIISQVSWSSSSA